MEEKILMLEDLIKDTAGANFYILCQGHTWSLRLTKSDMRYSGSFDDIITEAIRDIKENRTLRKDAHENKKPFLYIS